MNFALLASGSSGNCIVVSEGETCILIDAGISRTQIVERLRGLGITPEHISAICLTHDHSDHVGGLHTFLKKYPKPVYATEGTCTATECQLKFEYDRWNVFASGNEFRVGTLTLKPFAVPHDAGDPVGFVIRGEEKTLGIVTDLGYVAGMVKYHLKACDALIVESNHDREMLMNSTEYPWFVKERILGRCGHLSNEQCGDILKELYPGILSTVVLAHISEKSNTPTLARNNAMRVLRERNVADKVKLHVATTEPTGWLA